MKTLIKILPFLIFIIGITSKAQTSHLSSKKGESTLGIGLGLPYGAIGIKLGTNLTDNINLFGGVGYQISGIGYNIGFLQDFESKKATQLYLLAMYGTNAAIKVEGLSEYDKIYTGPTIGFGIKINSKKTEGNYWDIGILVPFRSTNFKEDIEKIKKDSRIYKITDPWPILFTFGYNFNISIKTKAKN